MGDHDQGDHLGPRLSRKPMHMVWLLDVSGSMGADGKIEALNTAMADAVASVRDAAAENPGVQVQVRVIAFAHEAAWHVDTPTDIEDFAWTDVDVVDRGTTELGLAIKLATEAIQEASQSGRGLPPALILVSDGKPTDLKAPSFGASLRALAEEPWGRRASRMAIGIGRDADMDALRRFIGHDEIEPLLAGSAQELRHYLRWASTVVVSEGGHLATDRHESPPAAMPPTKDVGEKPTARPTPDVAEAPTAAPTTDVEEAPTAAPPPPRRSAPQGPARRDLPPPPSSPPPPPADPDDVVW